MIPADFNRFPIFRREILEKVLDRQYISRSHPVQQSCDFSAHRFTADSFPESKKQVDFQIVELRFSEQRWASTAASWLGGFWLLSLSNCKMDSQGVGFYTYILNGDMNLEDFSMQNSQSEFTSGGSSSSRGKRKGNFSPEEDDLLVSAWLNISQDAIHSTDQKMDKYWERVHVFFHRNKKIVSKRSSISLMNRWSVIQKAVNKFCGCYAQIEGRNQSGMTEHDKILNAKAMYTEIYGGAFLLENCWNRLRSEPKWLVNGDKCTTTKKKSNKKKRKKDDVSSLEDSTAPSDINLEDKDSQDPSSVKKPRPSGKKQEQEKIKNKKSKEELDDTIVELMKEMEERKNSNTVKTGLLEKLLEIEEKKEEERIMSIDVTRMPQLQAEYYIQRQQNIMEKLKEGK